MRSEGRVGPFLFLSALAVIAGARAQTPPNPAPGSTPGTPAPAATIRWERDFDEALARAAGEKKPLFVAFLMDDEPANDQTIAQHYTDPQIVELSRRFVCLACCIGDHPGDDGCAKFPGVTCAQHQAIEKKARERWMVGDIVCTPQHVFCDSNGEVVLRRVYLIPKETLAKCLVMTLHQTGGDVSALPAVPDGGVALADKERLQVEAWLKELDSRNLELREAALRGLAYADDPRALPAVMQRCGRDFDDTTRLAAIGALARKGNYQAVDTLTALLNEPKAPIVIRVASSLETIKMPEAAPALLAASKKERRDRVLGVLLRAAANAQGSNKEIRDLCVKTLKGGSTQLKAHVLVALGRLDQDAKIVQAVVPHLESRNQNVRGLAVWALGAQHTPKCLEALQALQQEEKTPEVKKLLAAALRCCRGEKVEGYDSMYGIFLLGDY